MKNHYFKATGIFVISLFCSLCYGQVKQIMPPNIKSPFQSQSKNVKGKKALIVPSSQSAKTAKPSTEKLKTINGSFMLDFKNPNNSQTSRKRETRTLQIISNEFSAWFGLNKDHTFQLISEKEDDLKIMHSYYQQYYKDILVEGSILMLHSKEGLVDAANGQVAEFASMEKQVDISTDEAKNIAKSFLKVTDVINEYPVETLISKIPNGNGFDFKFVHMVRIDSSNPFVMANVYIDALNGTVLNTVSLVTNCLNTTSEKAIEKKPFMPLNIESNKTENSVLADTPSTANTLYSGTQNIVSDSFNGAYRLSDNARKIQTYDATNSVMSSTGVITNALEYTNNSTNWTTYPAIASITISSISQNWWYSIFGDTAPDLYVKVKNSSNIVIYNGRNAYKDNTFPSVTFNLYLPLSSQPYTLEIWDYDPVGGDEFGGSCVLSSTNMDWSVNGNSGSYTVITSNPALDAHWGIEKTYDFYLNVFGRKSYDGSGSAIKNYINPPDLQFRNDESPNNAYANKIYNYLCYGMGDGVTSNPYVSLDVVGHEFTHLVVEKRNNAFKGFLYQGETGALDESFADIFGTCIEFYTKPTTANWTLFEDFKLPKGNFSRSMLNPKSKYQPDTYNSTNGYWKNPANINFDYGGVHYNSGVQNYWFYLLAQNTSTPTITGTNGINNQYSVTSIGINKAREIAYKNLTTYLPSPTSTYMDSYYGSLLAAQDLYGNPSTEYSAVRQAWFAVGIGNDPNNSCSGTTNLTSTSGTFSDGSGKANYENNGNCTWVIAPPGATQVSINFTEFDTEATNDKVYVYDGADDTAPLLATWWGNTLPQTITTSAGTGAMCVKFISNSNITASGWTANYTSLITPPTCSGVTLLSTPTGTFTDGSGSANYTNNQQCFWYIAPPCATSVTLSLSQFNTEKDFDGIAVYDSLEATNLIGFYSGIILPASITSTTGTMLVLFISDDANVSQGFTANYTSTGSSYCTGTTTLNTTDDGSISDGSGTNTYCNNSNCSWLIQPPQATSVTLNFTDFELEQTSSDGNSIYDAVEVYDGTSSSAKLLGRFTGSNTPASITSSSGSMYIRFYSDTENAYQGWSAYYTSTQNTYCNSTPSTLTAPTGTFSDGSASDKYANNSNCSWLIQPANATTITLTFSSFDTELNYDGVIVYDGVNSSAPILNQFTGTSILTKVTSTGGSMYVVFLTDEAIRANGWNASYTSTTIPQIVISQVYGGGGNAGNPTFTNDFIELYNRGAVAQNLDGWSVQYAPATSQSWQLISLPNFQLQSGQYFLIKAATQGTTTTNPLPKEDFTSNVPLSSANGKVILVNSTALETTLNPTGSQIIDKVAYGTATFMEGTPTAVLSNTTSAIRNLGGCTDTDNNASDFTVDTPKPRNSASPIYNCSSLSLNQNIIEKFTLYPNPTSSKVFINNSVEKFEKAIVINYLGQVVGETRFDSFEVNQEVDLSSFVSGIYLVKFTKAEKTIIKKVIKQ